MDFNRFNIFTIFYSTHKIEHARMDNNFISVLIETHIIIETMKSKPKTPDFIRKFKIPTCKVEVAYPSYIGLLKTDPKPSPTGLERI